MAGLISETMTLDSVSPLMRVAWSRRRNAMSPVPPAMSSIVQGFGVLCALEEGEMPGFRARTKWSFQRRWMPRDIRSFMVS